MVLRVLLTVDSVVNDVVDTGSWNLLASSKFFTGVFRLGCLLSVCTPRSSHQHTGCCNSTSDYLYELAPGLFHNSYLLPNTQPLMYC